MKQDTTAEELMEKGYPAPEAPPVGEMPAGGGAYSVPHYISFGGLYNLQSRTYAWQFDEALRASESNAAAMWNDTVLVDALFARLMPTAQLSWHLEPIDETDNRQADAAKVLTEVVKATPRWQQFLMQLLYAVWFGKSAVRLVYEWDYATGSRRMRVRDFRPVNGDKLVFKWGGNVGVLVHGTFNHDNVEITQRGRAYFLTPAEREAMVVHHHMPEDAPYWQPEKAGSVMGVGVRGRVYWYWFLKQNILALLTDYLQRCASGFTIYYFDASNPDSAREVEEYVKKQVGQNAILFPRFRSGIDGYGVQRVEPGTAGAQLLESLVTGYFDDVMRRFILGQTLTSGTAPTGMGSGVADAHSDTLSRIVKFDAVDLQETLTAEFVSVLAKYNTPGVPPPRFVFDIDAPNSGETMQNAQILYEMGAPINGDELYEIVGLAKPGPNDTVLSKLNEMQLTALGQAPEGVPMEGAAGPQVQPAADGGVPASPDVTQPAASMSPAVESQTVVA